MQLDVLRHSGVIIRLHDFDHADLRRLQVCIDDLVCAARTTVPLHEEPFIQPRGGCRLTLRLAQDDNGIEPATEPNLFGWTREPGTWEPYACTLSAESWRRVEEGIEVLSRLRFLCSEHVWLHRQWHGQSTAAWLLSPDGDW